MHQQYKKCVILISTFWSGGTFTTWVMQHWQTCLPFFPLDGTEAFRMVKGIISPFNKIDRGTLRHKLPMRYYYSSGLNNPLGYK
jgi:hypothetical protein